MSFRPAWIRRQPWFAWEDVDVIIKRVGDEAWAIDASTREVIAHGSDHAKVINKAIEYLEDQYGGHIALLGKFIIKEPIVVPVTNYRFYRISGTQKLQYWGAPTILFCYVDDFCIKPDETDTSKGINGGMSIECLKVSVQAKNGSGIFTRGTQYVRDVEIERAGYLGVPDTKTVGLVVQNGNAYIVQNVWVHNFSADIVIPRSEHGLFLGIHCSGESGAGTEFGILMPHYHPNWWYDAGYKCLNPDPPGSRHHVFIDIHYFGSLREDPSVPMSGTAFVISGSLILFPKFEATGVNFIMTDGAPNVVIKPYITGSLSKWKFCSFGCGGASSDGEGNIVLGDVSRVITRVLSFSVSGDGTTTTFKLGTHDLLIRRPDLAFVYAVPESDDARIPFIVWLQDDDGDGIYESIYVKFASAPPAGTDNVKIRVFIQPILPF